MKKYFVDLANDIDDKMLEQIELEVTTTVDSNKVKQLVVTGIEKQVSQADQNEITTKQTNLIKFPNKFYKNKKFLPLVATLAIFSTSVIASNILPSYITGNTDYVADSVQMPQAVSQHKGVTAQIQSAIVDNYSAIITVVAQKDDGSTFGTNSEIGTIEVDIPNCSYGSSLKGSKLSDDGTTITSILQVYTTQKITDGKIITLKIDDIGDITGNWKMEVEFKPNTEVITKDVDIVFDDSHIKYIEISKLGINIEGDLYTTGMNEPDVFIKLFDGTILPYSQRSWTRIDEGRYPELVGDIDGFKMRYDDLNSDITFDSISIFDFYDIKLTPIEQIECIIIDGIEIFI
ncbi:MAG: hypothetical protein ATN35_01205 [Epulopiscium sp. Nele67-Bin004]|nr:MAG: hypothetical protein ATN35_01205 [Epulopiscium sp. Nele67-Bin004]